MDTSAPIKERSLLQTGSRWARICRARASLVAIAIVLTALTSATGTAAAATTTATTRLVAVADAHVSAAEPNRNFGKAGRLHVDSAPDVRSYLRFSLRGITGQVTRARLRVYSGSSSTSGFGVRSVSDSTWREGTITYSNAAALGPAVRSSGPVAKGSWVTVDVTPLIAGTGTVSLALTDSSDTLITLLSREATTTAVRLVVDSNDTQPSFPIRAAFYYPWFPEAWDQGGINPYTRYHPSLGLYDSGSSSVIQQNVRAMQYAGIAAGISSWWGQSHRTDTRLPTILSATRSFGSAFRWALYYENESVGDPSVSQIASDLAYIQDRYGSDPAYLRVDGRFVVFVYASSSDGCAMADRWRQAASGFDVYLVLKVFPGYRTCAGQPDSWHQYAPAVAADGQLGYSYSISPGFWKAGEPSPRLARDLARFAGNIRDMVASNAPWQLVATFNEWGEGTAVEAAAEWQANPNCVLCPGLYLWALHQNGNI